MPEMNTAIPTATTEQERPRKRGRPPGSRKSETISLHRAIVNCTKKDTSLSNREIADKLGCDRRTVGAVLAKYGIKQDELDAYKENQADILLGLQQRIGKSITDEDIQKAPLLSRTTALGILFDKFRMHTGQSTVNMASIISVAMKAEAQQIDANEPNT